jgi:hypothetical protein
MVLAKLAPRWPAERKADMADHKKTQPETVLNRRGALGLAAAVATFGAAMGIDVSDANAGMFLKYEPSQGAPSGRTAAPQPPAPQLQTQQPIKGPTTQGAPGPVQPQGNGANSMPKKLP